MKFKEAKKAIEEGRQVKCKYWTFDGKFIDTLGMIAFSVSIFKLYNDWEIVE